MGKESIYWMVVLLTLLYLVFKNYSSLIKVLIILCFYSGLASFAGKTIENPYKIIVVILSFQILLKRRKSFALNKSESIFIFVFLLFSISFLFSAFINDDHFNLVFSQYGKYVTPVCLYFMLNYLVKKNPRYIIDYGNLFLSLLYVQIFLSFIKMFVIGIRESTVGSIVNIGGGVATTLPVLGFILLWLQKQGLLKRKDWAYVFLLLFIGFVSYKRAIWFVMPGIILLFMYFVPRKVKIIQLLYFVPLVPLIFYAGIRLNPTLNKEGKIGGSFDLEYVVNYVQKYNFGKTSESNTVKAGTGRGGATVLILEKLFNGTSLSFNDFWGYGLKEIYATNYDEFDDEKFGLNSKGSATGIFQSYISSGYCGVVITLILLISIIGLIKEPRIRISVGFFLFWDYLFYSGLILRTQALLTLLFFIIIYSNYRYVKKNNRNRTSTIILNDQKNDAQLNSTQSQ